MNDLLAQLRLEREGRQRGADAPAQQQRMPQREPETLQPEPQVRKPEPEVLQHEPEPEPEQAPGAVPRESQPAALHEETASPAPEHAAEVQREQRLQHLRSRRRSRRSPAGRHGEADPPAPSLAGILGLAGSGEQATRALAGPAARRTPTPEELGFAPTLEATLSNRPVRTAEGDAGQRSLDREQRRPARRPRPTAAELGFSGDLAAVLNTARPRRQFLPEPEPEPELEPLLNEPWRDVVPERSSRPPSAASLGFHSESLETALQPVRVAEEHDDDQVPAFTQDAAAVGSSIHQERPGQERSAAGGGIRSMPDLVTTRQVDVQPDGHISYRDELNLAEPEHIGEDALHMPSVLSTDTRGVPAWSRASTDAMSPPWPSNRDEQQPQQPLLPHQPDGDPNTTSVPRDLQEENGGFYTGDTTGILDQDRTPFRLGGADATARTGASIPAFHGGISSGQQQEGTASAIGAQTQDPFLQAIEAASRPAEQPRMQHRQHLQQREHRRPTPAPSPALINQDHTPFPMGAARGGGDADRSGSAVRPDEHAADWEALARRSRAEGQVSPEDGFELERYRDANLLDRGRADRPGAVAAQPPHPEWVMPRRGQHPAPRPQPGRRRTSRANQRARAEETSEAARVALSSLLESSGEWTYEQLIALDDENESRAGLSYATVRKFERRRCTDDEKADGEACAICLEPYGDADWLKRLPCEHCFHEDCILHWFKDHTLCPMCRFDCQCA